MSIRRDGVFVQKKTKISASSTSITETLRSRLTQSCFNSSRDISRDLDERLYCNYCHQLLKNPCILDCKHVFCKRCVNTFAAHEYDEQASLTAQSPALPATPAPVGPMTFASLSGTPTLRPDDLAPPSASGRRAPRNQVDSEAGSCGGFVSCPVCHRESEGVTPQALHELFPDALCVECNTAIKEYRCEQCGGLSLCAKCDTEIHSHRALSTHLRVPILPEGRPRIDHPPVCAHHHDRAATHFCLETLTPLCGACEATPSHVGHRHATFDEAHPMLSQRIEHQIKAVDEWRHRAASQLGSTASFTDQTAHYLEAAENSLITARAELHTAIDSQFEHVHQQLLQLHQERAEYYSYEQEALRATLVQASEMSASARKQLNHRSTAEIVSMFSTLVDRLESAGQSLESASRAFRPPRPHPMPDVYTPPGIMNLIEGITINPTQVLHEPTHATLPPAEQARRVEVAQGYEAAVIEHAALINQHEEVQRRAARAVQSDNMRRDREARRQQAQRTAQHQEESVLRQVDDLHGKRSMMLSRQALPSATRNRDDLHGEVFCRYCHAAVARNVGSLRSCSRVRGMYGMPRDRLTDAIDLDEFGPPDNREMRCGACSAGLGRYAIETGASGMGVGLVYFHPNGVVEGWDHRL